MKRHNNPNANRLDRAIAHPGQSLSRRDFIRLSSLSLIGLAAGSCVSPTIQPSPTPAPTQTQSPSATATPSATPTPTATPQPTTTPAPTATPEPAATPQPKVNSDPNSIAASLGLAENPTYALETNDIYGQSVQLLETKSSDGTITVYAVDTGEGWQTAKDVADKLGLPIQNVDGKDIYRKFIADELNVVLYKDVNGVRSLEAIYAKDQKGIERWHYLTSLYDQMRDTENLKSVYGDIGPQLGFEQRSGYYLLSGVIFKYYTNLDVPIPGTDWNAKEVVRLIYFKNDTRHFDLAILDSALIVRKLKIQNGSHWIRTLQPSLVKIVRPDHGPLDENDSDVVDRDYNRAGTAVTYEIQTTGLNEKFFIDDFPNAEQVSDKFMVDYYHAYTGELAQFPLVKEYDGFVVARSVGSNPGLKIGRTFNNPYKFTLP